MNYLQHSPIANPGAYTHLLNDLPDDISGLCAAVRGLYVHYYSVPDFPVERRKEVDTRYMDAMLQQIIALDPRPLTEKRPVERRLVGCCRDAALLLCTFAQHKGIPARSRVGFANYINVGQPGLKIDHVVAELWDDTLQRWRLVDAEQSEHLIAENQIDFDVTDIPRDQFIVGGSAWQQIRQGVEPNQFTSEPGDTFVRGEWFVRNRLIQDLACLNQVELLLWDTWGWMEYEAVADTSVIDIVAEKTQHGTPEDWHILYQHPALKAPQEVMCYSPVQAWGKVVLR